MWLEREITFKKLHKTPYNLHKSEAEIPKNSFWETAQEMDLAQAFTTTPIEGPA